MKFDAKAGLTRSINGAPTATGTLQALRNMNPAFSGRRDYIFDQGQTDAFVANSLKSNSVMNSQNWRRLFALEYSGDVITMDNFRLDIHRSEI